ncbi:MAG: hypothetical protein WBP89_16940 [Sedimenticolaceae bacterium]
MTPLSRSILRACILAFAISLPLFVSAEEQACDTVTAIETATPGEIVDFFKRADKRVVTFIGYSGAEYEDRDAMLATAESILDTLDPAKTLVNIGATPEGIGAVYSLARSKGFVATGIVSTQAKEYDAALAPCIDRVFYVEDATWGGFLEGTDKLSPTSTAMVESSDLLIGIGGGAVGRDELTAAKRMGKEVRFFSADMNHRKAIEKAEKKGLPAPTSFSGAADEVF